MGKACDIRTFNNHNNFTQQRLWNKQKDILKPSKLYDELL